MSKVPENNFPEFMQYAAEACEEGHVYIYCGPSLTSEKGCPACRREEGEVRRAKEREANAKARLKAKKKNPLAKHRKTTSQYRNYQIKGSGKK